MKVAAIGFVVLAAFSPPGDAHREDLLIAGQETEISGTICSTRSQAESLLATYRDKGIQAGNARYAQLQARDSQNRVPCGMVTWKVIPLRRVATFFNLKLSPRVLDKHALYVVEVAREGSVFYMISDQDVDEGRLSFR